MAAGASVVTANKALLAEDGATLFAAAEAAEVDLYFEAAVAGAIPIIRPLRESLVGDEITSVIGIVNGTTNYILDKMDVQGAGFGDILAEAQELGYAEADPTADVEGFDSAAKAAILSSLAFHSRVTAADVYREGITEVTASDIAAAREIGCLVKLLAICELVPDCPSGPAGVGLGTRPSHDDSADASAGLGGRGVQRCVRRVPLGRAADVLRTRRRRLADGQRGARGPGDGGPQPTPGQRPDRVNPATQRRPVSPIGRVLTRYHISLEVDDVAGVLATIAQCFAEHDVSIQTVRQQGRGAEAQLVIVTHRGRDADLSATVADLERLPAVRAVSSVMRVEGE